jgi:hypothetical protein
MGWALTLIEKLSSPAGNSLPLLASHVIVPLILALSPGGTFNNCFHSELSVKNLNSDPAEKESLEVLKFPDSSIVPLRYRVDAVSKVTEEINASSGVFLTTENRRTPESIVAFIETKACPRHLGLL